MKICSTCKTEKEDSDFYSRGKARGGSPRNDSNSMCKPCFNAYCVARWLQRKKDAVEYMGSSCHDCGLKHDNNSYIFDFHHLDKDTKEKDWTKLRLCSWQKITDELDKCVMLCSNCHRTRHYHIDMVITVGFEPTT